MWELDVAMSADGELFVVHDDTLERTSNAARAFPDRRPWSNHTFTLAEIRSLDFGSWFFEPRRQVLEQKGEGIVHEPGVDPVIVVENEDEIVGDCGDVIEQGGEQRLDGRRAARASCCPGNTMTAR